MVVARQALWRTSIRLGTACALRIFANVIFGQSERKSLSMLPQ